MAEFFDYNPRTGTWYEHDVHYPDGEGAITIKQDLQPVLDHCKDMRNSGVNDKAGDFAHYALIPAWLQVDLLKKGIRFGRQEDTGRLIKEIEQNYPRFKVTNLRHHVRS